LVKHTTINRTIKTGYAPNHLRIGYLGNKFIIYELVI